MNIEMIIDMEKNMKTRLFILTKLFTKETISYLIFGVLTTVVDAVTFYLCNNILKLEYIISTIMAWILAIFFAYFTNKIWVFKSKENNIYMIWKEILSFFFSRLVSLIFTLLWMVVTVELLKFNEFISKILANFFVVIMNYFFSKLFIFKDR